MLVAVSVMALGMAEAFTVPCCGDASPCLLLAHGRGEVREACMQLEVKMDSGAVALTAPVLPGSDDDPATAAGAWAAEAVCSCSAKVVGSGESLVAS